jgi:hypothetical protein
MSDPLSKDAYGVALLVMFGGGALLLQGAATWRNYKDAGERIDKEVTDQPRDDDPASSAGPHIQSAARLTLAAAVAGTMAAIIIAARTEAVFGWMFESGVAIAIILSRPQWAAVAAISLQSVRYGTTVQGDAGIMRNPWGVYPMFGSAAFLLLGIPVAAVSQHQYDPAYLTVTLLPFAFAMWIVIALEPLVKWLTPLPKDHSHLVWLSAIRHPIMSALTGAAIFATIGLIMAIHDSSGVFVDSGGLAYVGAMMGIMFWEGKCGTKARRIRAHDTRGGHS